MKGLNFREVIPAKYCIPNELLQEYRKIISTEFPRKKTGRPRSDSDSLVAGIFYLLKTGCQWDALPLCFGPAKTVYHRFTELVEIGAFQKIWKTVLMQYDQGQGLMLGDQSVDSMHKKSPLGGEETGISPVDRRKLGTTVGLVVEEKSCKTTSKNKYHNQEITLFVQIKALLRKRIGMQLSIAAISLKCQTKNQKINHPALLKI